MLRLRSQRSLAHVRRVSSLLVQHVVLLLKHHRAVADVVTNANVPADPLFVLVAERKRGSEPSR
jgi:hypothetical protein